MRWQRFFGGFFVFPKIIDIESQQEYVSSGWDRGISRMNDQEKPLTPAAPTPTGAAEELPKTVSTQDPFDGHREICTEPDGEPIGYASRRNKLILQK